jgi:hypothetical protein
MKFGRKENIFIISVLFILATLITYIQYHKFVHGSAVRADTGFLLEMTENIANGKGHISSIHAAMNLFHKEDFLTTNAEVLCKKNLGKVKEEFRIVFESHRYYITYVVAAFAKVFDTKAIYYTTHVFGFFILLYMLYRILRESDVPIIPALLFLTLVFVHPAFSQSISGQLYAERFFIPFAMIFLYFLNKKGLSLLGLYFSASLICLVSERSPLMMGIFIFGYIILFWNNIEQKRKMHLVVIGTAILSFALYSMKVLKESNLWYSKSTFMPSSVGELMDRFSNPSFMDNLLVFGIFSFIFLGIFSATKWKYFLMAFVMMIPNIVGNIGGAEKYGYLTHYHTLYFPFLVFASSLGYIKLIGKFKQKKHYYILSIFMIGLILLSSAYSPYSRNLSSKNMMQENALLKDLNLYPDIFDKKSFLRQYLGNYQKIADSIPDGSTVTSGEMAQVILWKDKINYFYPMGIDVADYAVLFVVKKNDKYEYSGAISYLGAEEAKKIDKCMIKRMKNLGYDFKNQIILNSFAIIKRNKK